LLVAAGFRLMGEGGVAALTVRSACREAKLNSRYFYDNFANTDELLAAVYDHVVAEMGDVVFAAMELAGQDRGARTRAGIRAVLVFASDDPRRGRVLFTDARSHPVLADRLIATQALVYQLAIAADDARFGDIDPRSKMVGAALFTGAMTELVVQWLAGRIGDDVDAVTDYALERVLAF
jgi:AcrR family transcriptional regulator